MLRSLFIENIAIIERASITLYEGLNVLTGETGAGKSIIIDALGAVLGQRTTRDIVRSGAASASVAAEFVDIGPAARALLAELGFPPDEDVLVLSRTMSADGKGSCRVGGRPATLANLAAIAGVLVNIHGQHDSQSLLNPDTHYLYLDALASNTALLTRYTACFDAYVALRREQKALTRAEQDKAARMDFLQYQVQELREADLVVGETEQLKSRLLTCRHAEQLRTVLAKTQARLTNDDGETAGALPLCRLSADALSKCGELDPALAPLADRLLDTVFELEAVAAQLTDRLDGLDGDPDELERLEARLDLIYRLTAKFGGDEEAPLRYLEQAEQELSAIEQGSARLAALDEELDRAGAQLLEAAGALTESRQKAARALETRVCEQLRFLNMPDVRFVVELTAGSMRATGADRVAFLISANAGAPVGPLAKIASGGELSRVMLAIKSVLAVHDEVDTLIFDEIDTGVSGRAADKVGALLLETGGSRQVLCVTHLAQIAARADHQYLIEKNTGDGRTATSVTHLDFEGRRHEIARIMGGENITETTLRSAEELLNH